MIITEPEFKETLKTKLEGITAKAVTGPGRSGAVAAVYSSYILGIPFIPYGQRCPNKLRPLLIVDTAAKTGKTIRKAAREYDDGEVITVVCYNEPPRVRFWYEFKGQ